ncbi:MAG: thioredoxin domain-containing protein [Acidobacteria bacterium]|nr:thioredoxin domain-containing protein [Acidobacteriota bacterium]
MRIERFIAIASFVVITGPGLLSAAEGAGPAERSEVTWRQVDHHSPQEGSPSLGPPGAGTTLLFYTDYQCPVCPRAARELPRLVAELDGMLRVEFRHNPLTMHRSALDAAAASRAAQRQGRFWEYHELLLQSRRFDRETLVALAERLSLHRDSFVRDLDDLALRDGILAEAEQARSAGAEATPGFLIKGKVQVGWGSYPQIRDFVRKNLQ